MVGIVLVFGFIIFLMLVIYSENKFLKSFYFVFLSFIFIVFFFIYLRGLYIIFLFVFLVFFLFLLREKRILFIFNIVIVGVFVIVFLNKVGVNLNEYGKIKFWFVLFF